MCKEEKDFTVLTENEYFSFISSIIYSTVTVIMSENGETSFTAILVTSAFETKVSHFDLRQK